MIKLFKYEITEKAIEEIEYYYEIDRSTLTPDRVDEIIEEMKYGVLDGYKTIKLIVDGNNEFVWTEEDIERICYVCDMSGVIGDRGFYEVKELNIYVSENMNDGEYYYEGNIGDASYFIDFLGEGKEFVKNVRNLVWGNDDDILFEALEEILNELDDDNEDDDYIELQVWNKWSCTLEEALRSNQCYKDSEFEEMGCFAGEIIYRIDKRLYYIGDNSYHFNTEHQYCLYEVSKKCYEEFGLDKPLR